MAEINVNLYIYCRTNFLDQEWLTFETAGTLIVGWEGGPLHHANMTEPGERSKDKEVTKTSTTQPRDDSDESSDDDMAPSHLQSVRTKKTMAESLDLAGYDRPRTTTTGIEIAAALATGMDRLTLSQTTNFKLFQTERVCRQQFEI